MWKSCIAALASVLAMSAWAVDVNKGSADELAAVSGIGPATSQRIIAERDRSGSFKSWEDFISRVKGIGDKSAGKLSVSGLTVNGGAYKAAAAPAKDAGKDKAAAARSGAQKNQVAAAEKAKK